VVAGLDTSGAGAVYTYDAVGSYERVGYAAQGQGQKLIIPLLDDIVGGRNRADAIAPLTLAAAVETVKEAFIVAGERDIYTGDAVEIFRCGRAAAVVGRLPLLLTTPHPHIPPSAASLLLACAWSGSTSRRTRD